MISNRTKREVFDLLWTKGGTGSANDDTWIAFRKATAHYALFPVPDAQFQAMDLYYISGKEKIAWIDGHEALLRPLLHWWENR